MVAPLRTKKVYCTVVCVPVAENGNSGSPERFSTRPSRLLPWADPYIAKLVHNLQEEVRNERQQRCCRGAQTVRADLDPPSPATDPDGGRIEETRWNLWDDSYNDPQE